MPRFGQLRTKKEVVGESLLPWLNFLPLWQLDIAEVRGHNLEARTREEVNRMLQEGWVLLHIYTLKYAEDGVWRERPMAILGKPRRKKPEKAYPRGATGENSGRTLLFPDFRAGSS